MFLQTFLIKFVAKFKWKNWSLNLEPRSQTQNMDNWSIITIDMNVIIVIISRSKFLDKIIIKKVDLNF